MCWEYMFHMQGMHYVRSGSLYALLLTSLFVNVMYRHTDMDFIIQSMQSLLSGGMIKIGG